MSKNDVNNSGGYVDTNMPDVNNSHGLKSGVCEGQNRGHGLFSPSRLPILKRCPYWVGSEIGNEHSERGDALHQKIIEAFLSGETINENESIDYALGILKSIKERYPLAEWEAEVSIDSGIPYVTGYADIVGFDYLSFDTQAVLVEIKSGYSSRESAESNLQVMAYSLGLLRDVEVVHAFLIEIDKRSYSTATFAREDCSRLANEIASVIKGVVKQEGSYTPGGYCDYCSKAVICPSLEGALQSIETYKESIEQVKHLPPDEVAKKLMAYWDKMALVESYWSNLKARAMAILEAGGQIEGFEVKVSSGVRKWIDEASAIEAFEKLGVSLKSVMALQSPAKVEKVLKESGMNGKSIKSLLSQLTEAGKRKQLVKLTGPSEGTGLNGSQDSQDLITIQNFQEANK